MIYGRTNRTVWLALAPAIALIGSGCGPSSPASEAEAGQEFIKTVNVEVQPVTRTDFTSYIRLTGEVEALNDVTLSAEESGVIERFFVEKGNYVRSGAALAKIRDNVLRAQVEEAMAAAELARERYERQRRLWEEEQIGSEIAYLEAKYQADLQAARVALLSERLRRTTIVTPISGIFDERYVDAGEMVAPGTPVARVVEVDRVKVTGGVAERFAAAVNPGDSAQINLDVLPDEEFIGVIGYVGSVVDERNRTFPIEIVIANPGRAIKPKMVASVEIANDRLQDVVVIPQDAVERTEDGYQVFVVVERDGGSFAESRPVRLGPMYANRVVIEEGLSAGEQLVVRGQQLVEAGNRVRIVSPAEFQASRG
ncbi:MAG: efflux RND transporter periplasmic adaptor subunit [Gemmatimonadota bacterium]|nr:MAG: efflux RND transporter periplasmic adaptor subunit [Gemmatimonadota bacterium]